MKAQKAPLVSFYREPSTKCYISKPPCVALQCLPFHKCENPVHIAVSLATKATFSTIKILGPTKINLEHVPLFQMKVYICVYKCDKTIILQILNNLGL